MMLALNHIRVDYKDRPGVLADIDLSLAAGQIVGLVAPNGTGKTTLLKTILNRLHPSRGSVEVAGLRYGNQAQTTQVHRQLCTFPEQADLYPELTGRAHLKFYAASWGSAVSVQRVIDRLQMSGYADRPVRTYSLGMKQRLCFALVVAADAPVMLLDEVMNGLDPLNIALLSEVITDLRQAGKLIIMVSHLLDNLASLADRVLFLKAGRIVHELDLHGNRPRYLKFRGAALTGATDYGQGLKLLALADLSPAALATAQATLNATGIDYTIGPLSLTEEFNHFYLA